MDTLLCIFDKTVNEIENLLKDLILLFRWNKKNYLHISEGKIPTSIK